MSKVIAKAPGKIKGVAAFFFFIVLGTRPVIKQGTDVLRRICPNCGDWRNFQEVRWRNYFTLFFIPLFPLGPERRGYACSACGLTMSVEAAHAPAPSYGPSPEK
ncbi:MAG: zinc-ribbon domain-containing protein [Bacillota bacterium]